MKKNQILKIYGSDFKEMTKRLLDTADALCSIDNPHALIGIKPNLVSPSTADFGATTHPEIVSGIIEYLKENGFDNMIMLESSWVGSKTSEAIKYCGYKDLSEKYDVPFYDLQKDSFQKRKVAGFEMDICEMALKLDFLINVPVLKGHCQTRITCALKNMKGLITNKEKRHFHSCGLHKPIACLNAAIRQNLIVCDNICGDLDFEEGGHPVVRNCIMLALDPVLLDAYGAKLMHLKTEDVPYIGLSEKFGVGSNDLSNADISVIRETKDFKEGSLPYLGRVISLRDKVSEIDSCSACYGYLLPALQRLKDEGLLELLDEEICIGQGYRGKAGKLGVGNCTRLFDTFVKGCPPTEDQIYAELKEYIRREGKLGNRS